MMTTRMSSGNFWGVTFWGIFDFSIQRLISSKDGDWCFINGLDAKSKILIDLLCPLMICLMVFLICIFSKCIIKKPVIIRDQMVDFQAVGVSVFCLIIGVVLYSLFKLLSCKSVGGRSVHYYFGNEECYNSTWVLSFLFLLFIIVSFSALILWILRMSKEERLSLNGNGILNGFIPKLIDRFQPGYWYWEFVLFLRRLITAYFAVGLQWEIQWVLLILMMFLILIQVYCKPFDSPQSNTLEIVCLCCTAVMVLVANGDGIDHGFWIMVLLSLLVILPVLLMMYFVAKMWRERVERKRINIVSELANHVEMNGRDGLGDGSHGTPNSLESERVEAVPPPPSGPIDAELSVSVTDPSSHEPNDIGTVIQELAPHRMECVEIMNCEVRVSCSVLFNQNV